MTWDEILFTEVERILNNHKILFLEEKSVTKEYIKKEDYFSNQLIPLFLLSIEL